MTRPIEWHLDQFQWMPKLPIRFTDHCGTFKTKFVRITNARESSDHNIAILNAIRADHIKQFRPSMICTNGREVALYSEHRKPDYKQTTSITKEARTSGTTLDHMDTDDDGNDQQYVVRAVDKQHTCRLCGQVYQLGYCAKNGLWFEVIRYGATPKVRAKHRHRSCCSRCLPGLTSALHQQESQGHYDGSKINLGNGCFRRAVVDSRH